MNPGAQTQKLLEDLGFDHVSAEQRQIILNKLQEMVDIEILYAVTSRLTDAQIEELDAVTNRPYESDTVKGQAIVTKMQELLPNYDEIVGRALEDLYKQIRADAQSVEDFLRQQSPLAR